MKRKGSLHRVLIFLFGIAWAAHTPAAQPPRQELTVHISWGHAAGASTPYDVRVTGEEVTIADVRGEGLEAGEGEQDGVWRTWAGAGDVDGIVLSVTCNHVTVTSLTDYHVIWRELIAQSDADTARRLTLDAGSRRDRRKLTIALDPDRTRGCSLTIDQLLVHGVFWVPALDLYIAAGDQPASFEEHQQSLEPYRGRRVLDQVDAEPEATYEQYASRWEDMGSPAYVHKSQPAPGHVIALTWDSAIPKYGIDRGAGVWNDYGNPDRFRFWLDAGEYGLAIRDVWRGQQLQDGLPIVTTTLERGGVRYEIEQFAYPLDGPPPERRGDIPLVLMQKVKLTNLVGEPKSVPLAMTHRREFPTGTDINLSITDGVIEETRGGRVLFSVQGLGPEPLQLTSHVEKPGAEAGGTQRGRSAEPAWTAVAEARSAIRLPAGGSLECIVKLPSPVVLPQDRAKLLALDYASARAETVRFWSDYVARGAQFRVPEKAVNDLFRTTLWHALRLPRRHGDAEPGVAIDLPYSNFAYSQQGTPWPVNQAIYVDYMLYDLRGYHAIAAEELLVMYRNNQEPSGRVGGFANWGVYTPSMLYAVAQHYLLSRDAAAFEQLLPPTLKALDWCLSEIRQAPQDAGAASGLVRAPLNDLTGDGVSAFNQAYFYAGLELLGRALRDHGHPRAQECLDAAQAFRQAVTRGFAMAMVQSPLVQLRDHTWTPYVPCDVSTPRRMMDIWYPTDVDTGAVHLLRLKALDAAGLPADALLHDHEDNLYLHGWGMANEPVYNPQATAYLLRDEPKAAVRAFYSYMACAFSHSVYEAVEHRWAWPQYFCPPSTDGAWFDLYRHMLIHERDDQSLLLFPATPRNWLADGRKIEIARAPTYFGRLTALLESRAAQGEIRVEIDLAPGPAPQALLVRVRHPESRTPRLVTVNGQPAAFDAVREWVRLDKPAARQHVIVLSY